MTLLCVLSDKISKWSPPLLTRLVLRGHADLHTVLRILLFDPFTLMDVGLRAEIAFFFFFQLICKHSLFTVKLGKKKKKKAS